MTTNHTPAEPFDSDRINRESDEIVEACKPFLAGRHPGIQACALADLLAMWLVGHPENIEADLLASHTRGVLKLTAIYRKRKPDLGPSIDRVRGEQ